MKKINSYSAIAVTAVALCAGNVHASSFLNTVGGLYSTGVNNSGGILTDNDSETHYSVRISTGSGSTGSVVDVASAYDFNGTYSSSGLVTVTSANIGGTNASQTAGYVGIDTAVSSRYGSGTGSNVNLSAGTVANTSAWISINDASTGTAAKNQYYTYRTSFDLTGFDLNSVAISGLWASDNRGKAIYLNGTKITTVDYYGTGTATQANYGVSSLKNFSIAGFNSFLVDGENYLDFQVRNDWNNATGLRVQIKTATVPVPATVWLFSSGLFGLFGLRRRGSVG
jgi:hypothetical protein